MSVSEHGSQHTFITYIFRDSARQVVYVGRARGYGTPEQVLQQRLAKGHHVFDNNPGLKSEVQAYQGNQEANMGAEDVWYAYYRRTGAPLLNDPQTPPLSSRPDRLDATRRRIQAYTDGLKEL